jgi:hypothetical protein
MEALSCEFLEVKLLTVFSHADANSATTEKSVHLGAINYRDTARIDNLSRPRFIAFVVAASTFYRFLKSIEFIFYRSVIAHSFVCEHDLILSQKGVCNGPS